MNFIEKIFGAKKEKKAQITLNLEQVLKSGKMTTEEILYFKIIRLEIRLKNAKNNLKLFLKPPKITRKK